MVRDLRMPIERAEGGGFASLPIVSEILGEKGGERVLPPTRLIVRPTSASRR